MGYYTSFSLEWKPRKAEVEIALEAQKEKMHGLNSDGSGSESVKWYDHAEDMREFSKLFPDVIFMLRGVGEENSDVWQKKFVNGQQWTSRAELKFRPFVEGNDDRSVDFDWPDFKECTSPDSLRG